MGKLSRFNPAGGVADFWTEFRKPQPYRIPILLVSFGIPLTGTYFLAQEKHMIPPERPEVTYITSFAPGRTDAEIIASNIDNQRRKEAEAARIAELEEQTREAYRALGRATGIDVDAMEREIAAERAAEKRAAEASAAEARRRAAQQTGAAAPPPAGGE